MQQNTSFENKQNHVEHAQQTDQERCSSIKTSPKEALKFVVTFEESIMSKTFYGKQKELNQYDLKNNKWQFVGKLTVARHVSIVGQKTELHEKT